MVLKTTEDSQGFQLFGLLDQDNAASRFSMDNYTTRSLKEINIINTNGCNSCSVNLLCDTLEELTHPKLTRIPADKNALS